MASPLTHRCIQASLDILEHSISFLAMTTDYNLKSHLSLRAERSAPTTGRKCSWGAISSGVASEFTMAIRKVEGSWGLPRQALRSFLAMTL